MDVAEQRVVPIWVGNLRVVTLFFDLAGCWRHGPMGDLLGIDWAQAVAMMQLRGDGRRHWRRMRDGLMAMERSVLDAVR